MWIAAMCYLKTPRSTFRVALGQMQSLVSPDNPEGGKRPPRRATLPRPIPLEVPKLHRRPGHTCGPEQNNRFCLEGNVSVGFVVGEWKWGSKWIGLCRLVFTQAV